MTVQIEAEGRNIPFALERENLLWHSSEDLKESDFPLITNVNGRCDELYHELYEIYSDETFATVETDWTD